MRNFTYRVKDEWNLKKDYIRMERCEVFYSERNHTSNTKLIRLRDLFNDQGVSVEWVKEALLNSTGRGRSGELTRISVCGDRVILKPTEVLCDEPEEHTVEIDRNVLLKLTNDWQALVKAKAPEIFIYEKDGELFVRDTLPEGME